ncbi:TD and POZ domain-containing protein 2-like [Halichondria panicea]|uniref:TD and POZ domain-containing protein 2-like n=1 Tax=Halichondria panicea TaxID=6063 RepID=UPI00312B5BFC
MATSNNFVKAEFCHQSEKSKFLSSSDGVSNVQRKPQRPVYGGLLGYNQINQTKSDYGINRWELAYKSNVLHLTLLSGAASAEVHYFVYVQYYYRENKKETVFSSGSATIQRGVSTGLNMCYYESTKPLKMSYHSPEAKTFIEFCILRLNPVVEIPERSTLSAALSSTLDNDKDLNDVMLYFGKEKELVQASKFLLTARSPVFKIMFEADMKEAAANEVTIDDITPAVGKEMIAYIYTDKAPKIRSMAEKLWFAAEKYQLPGLKALCENEIVKQLDVDNAAHFFLFAGSYCGDGKFKEYVLSFITKDKDTCSKVMRSDEWTEVKKFPELAFAVSDKFFDVTAEPAAKRLKLI